jgi:hypothetical protein
MLAHVMYKKCVHFNSRIYNNSEQDGIWNSQGCFVVEIVMALMFPIRWKIVPEFQKDSRLDSVSTGK